MNNLIMTLKAELKDKSDNDKIALLQQLSQYINKEINLTAEKVNVPFIERINLNS